MSKLKQEKPSTDNYEIIGLDKIQDNPNNPRKYFNDEELKELSNSIQSVGIIQPLTVRIMECICGFDDIREEIDTLTLQLEEKSTKQKEKLEAQIAELKEKLSKTKKPKK